MQRHHRYKLTEPARHNYMGRRSEDDARQITRWKQMTRHIAQFKEHCEPGDPHCQPRQRQALLHRAYDSRKM